MDDLSVGQPFREGDSRWSSASGPLASGDDGGDAGHPLQPPDSEPRARVARSDILFETLAYSSALHCVCRVVFTREYLGWRPATNLALAAGFVARDYHLVPWHVINRVDVQRSAEGLWRVVRIHPTNAIGGFGTLEFTAIFWAKGWLKALRAARVTVEGTPGVLRDYIGAGLLATAFGTSLVVMRFYPEFLHLYAALAHGVAFLAWFCLRGRLAP